MSELTGYVCWSRANVQATIATEAVSPSDSVFVATHAPLDIRRVTVAGGDTGTIVTEPELLAEFLDRPTNNGVLVAPVLGTSGAGKSHLVRWVHTRIPDAPGRRVIYLRKESTSLAGVVGELMMGLSGEPFDEIRKNVGRLGRDVTREVLEHRLLNELAESLRAAAGETPQERALCGETGLYLLLHDPVFRTRLLRPGALVPRRAEHAIAGRGSADTDVPLQFTEDDLPADVLELSQAAAASQRLFRQLVASDVLRRTAITLLNRHLDVAVMQAAYLGVGRVQEAFLEIRRALATSGDEIVLLVEDFALVQGIQRDLLEAIIETGVRDGRNVLAPIRTLLAVTSGYYESLPLTVRTRIESSTPFRYELAVTLGRRAGASAATEQRAVDFVGRYLNAARLGRDRIDAIGAADAEAVPNRCDECPVQEQCHAGFGTASTGHGLYPYNRAALLRAVRSAAPPDEEPGSFNPRTVLSRVVKNVLLDYDDDIAQRAFPNDRFAAEFPARGDEPVLSAAVADQATSTVDGERRRQLLEFWGGAPAEFGNLAPEIHEAFAIPPVSGADAVPAPRPPDDGDAKASPKAAVGGLLPSAQKYLRAIEDWNGRGGEFPQDVARLVRGAVHRAIVSRITWADPATRDVTDAMVLKGWPNDARTIGIEGARDRIARNVTPPIWFARTPESARFFEDLVKIANKVTEGTLEARMRLDRLAAEYADVARERVLAATGRTDPDLRAALKAAVAGAVAAGVTVPKADVADLLSAALTKNLPPRGDQAIRSELWTRTVDRHAAERGKLVDGIRDALGASQGATGEVNTVDAVRAVALLKAVKKDRQPDDPASWPEWARSAAGALLPLPAAVDSQLEVLRTVLAEIRARLPRGTGFAETAKAVEQAIEAGDAHGYVRADDVRALRERNTRATEVATSRDADALERDLESLGDDAPYERRLAVAAVDRGPGLGLMRDFLVENDRWLDAGLPLARTGGDDDVQELVERVGTVVGRWRAVAADEEA